MSFSGDVDREVNARRAREKAEREIAARRARDAERLVSVFPSDYDGLARDFATEAAARGLPKWKLPRGFMRRDRGWVIQQYSSGASGKGEFWVDPTCGLAVSTRGEWLITWTGHEWQSEVAARSRPNLSFDSVERMARKWIVKAITR